MFHWSLEARNCEGTPLHFLTWLKDQVFRLWGQPAVGVTRGKDLMSAILDVHHVLTPTAIHILCLVSGSQWPWQSTGNRSCQQQTSKNNVFKCVRQTLKPLRCQRTWAEFSQVVNRFMKNISEATTTIKRKWKWPRCTTVYSTRKAWKMNNTSCAGEAVLQMLHFTHFDTTFSESDTAVCA